MAKAAPKDALEGLGDELECAICNDHFKCPKYLQCMHTFCEECLIDLAKSMKGRKKFPCPLCRQETPVPAEGISKGLKTNFMALSILEKLPLLTIGGVTVATNGGGGDNSGDENRCPVHLDQVLNYYCRTCHQLVCRECCILDHCRPDHDVKEVRSKLQQCRAQNEHVVEPILQPVSTLLENVYMDDVGMTNGCGDGQAGEVITNDAVGSPFQIKGQQQLSVAGSDLGSEVNSEGGSSFDSGRCSGDSTSSNPPLSLSDEPTKYQLEFPSKFCGKLIGKKGRNIKKLKEKTKASVLLKEHPYLEKTHLVIIEGSQTEIDAALRYINDRFSNVDVTKKFKPPVIEAPKVPNISQLPLPEEIINDVYVSSVLSAAHIFVQQPTHPTFMALQGLDMCMANTYNQQADTVSQLPRPIEVGVICAAPMMQGWYRAQVVEVYPETDECDIRFLDYGGYARIEGYGLRQIQSDFMTLPFQTVECYLINLIPLPGENDYSETARVFVEQVSQNFTGLHAKVKGYSQDGTPLAELYYTDNERKVHSLNKELVNQGLVSWFEGY
ncbi:A-kinase anchor protein 1, mitochondrial-like [Amphiura filiformis]|uniref:A-kinase anchor protein 1, mitochondrial-like n=1 Tax=Amphiura filiformis TaxID=82378 RepID=UPI003B20E001